MYGIDEMKGDWLLSMWMNEYLILKEGLAQGMLIWSCNLHLRHLLQCSRICLWSFLQYPDHKGYVMCVLEWSVAT